VYEEQATAIATYTQQLRELMAQCTMLSIAQSAAAGLWMLLQRGFGGVDMHSPYRQVCHILGMALTSQERPNAPPITKEQWQKAKELSTRIFDQYGLMYFRKPSEMQGLSDDERRRIEVTMGMFLQYLGAPPMRSEDQLLARVKALYVPFDDVLRRELGFSASDLLRLLDCIKDILEGQFDRVVSTYQYAADCHKQFMALWNAKGWSLEQTRAEAKRHPVGQAIRENMDAMQNLWRLRRADLDREVGACVADRMLALLGTGRGLEADAYKYATDPSPAVRYPLLVLDEDALFCASHSFLYYAAELHFDPVLSRSEEVHRFFETRDTWVERRVAATLASFLGKDGTVWQGVCETSDAQFEHDVVARVGGTWLISEVKAAPVRRSFFDPDRAFVRIRDDFRSDRGIQKAYEQGERFRQILLTSNQFRFFSTDGSLVIDQPGPAKEVFVICVTGEFWGNVAIDLSLLLEKSEDAPYPWAVCIDDLEAFLKGLKAWGKSPDHLLKFLRQRSKLHGRSFSEDELNIAGYFIEHGALPALPNDPKPLLLFTPENSSVFDEVFFEAQGTPLKRNRDQELQKYMRGLRDSAEPIAGYIGMSSIPSPNAKTPTVPQPPRRKVGRNAPCPCGSGRKYKRCCGG
jgi:hypothetical protein